VKKIQIFLSSFALCTLLCGSCVKDHNTKTFVMSIPVFKVKSEVLASIKSMNPQPITQIGKIYIKGNTIFLAEKGKGIHVINQSNPAALVNQSFINLPGSEDIAIIGNTLYADCATDLLVLNLTETNEVELIKSIPNIFPDKFSKYGNQDSNMVFIEYRKVDTTMEIKSYSKYMSGGLQSGGSFDNSFSVTGNSTSTGIAGSMARFTIAFNHLYTVSPYRLTTFSVADSKNPIQTDSKQLGWNIETIYPFKNNLFIGTQSGMIIYNLANPALPIEQGKFAHARLCDPVIADNQYAYVTLRNGSQCQGFLNELDIIDISDLANPVFRYKINFTNPHGLAKDGNVMMICDGVDGIKILDASNPLEIKQKIQLPMANSYDVIMNNGIAYLISETEMRLYNYNQDFEINLIGALSK
jgi:hypothetical protein